MDVEFRFSKLWRWYLRVTFIFTGICYGQLEEPKCTSDMKLDANGCLISIEIMSDILKDYYSGHEDRGKFCSNKFEQCVKAVNTAALHKCEGIDPSKEEYHSQVDALRGFCQDIGVWQSHKACIDAQVNDGLKVCHDKHYIAKQNFSQNEFKNGKYDSDYARRNARCRLLRSYQECNEDVLYAQCSDYYPYFKDYQVALLTPYCRQLYLLTSRYVTDDPNTAVSQRTLSLGLVTVCVFLGSLISRFSPCN